MASNNLREARVALGLNQQRAAKRLGVSQAYLSLIERGRRRLTERLGSRCVRFYHLPPTELPMEFGATTPPTPEDFARTLAALGYPGFAYLSGSKPKNPAWVLLAALSSPNLEVRIVEALPWLVTEYPNLDWESLLKESKLREIQNRLGFVVALAKGLSARDPGAPAATTTLAAIEARLERCRLAREDTLCQESLTDVERRWLRASRSPEAAHWNLLTDLE